MTALAFRPLWHIAFTASGLLLGACAAPAPPLRPTLLPAPKAAELFPTTLHASASCGTERPSARPVTDAALLTRIARSGHVPAPDQGIVPTVDFASSTVVQLSMGQQPSAGFEIGVVSASLDHTTDTLTVNTFWKQPDAAGVPAQVITRPCVVFSLPRTDYRTLRVLDQQQQERMLLELNAGAR